MDFEKFRISITKQMSEVFKTKDQYKSLGVKGDELLKLFSPFIDKDGEFQKEYPTFKSEIESDTSVEVWTSMIRGKFLNYAKKKYSKSAVEGELYALGITEPFDYLVPLKKKQKDIIKDLISDRTKGKNIDDAINKLVADGFCNRDFTKLYDNRKNDKGELKKKNKDGSPMEWPNTAYLASIYGVFTYKDDAGKEVSVPLVQTVGGEFGDKVVNPVCTKCGKDDMHRTCPSCNTEKPEYIVEAYMRLVGKVCKVMMQKDAKNGTFTLDFKKTSFENPRDMTGVEKEELYKKMRKVFKSEYFVTGATIPKWHNLFEKDRKAVMFYRGFVSDKYERVTKLGRTMIFNDEDLLANDRLNTFIPQHVFDYNLDKVRVDSDVVVIGGIIKFNKTSATSSNFSNSFPYSFKAAGVLVMRNEKPIVVDTGVLHDKLTISTVPVTTTPSVPSKIEQELKEYQQMQQSSDSNVDIDASDEDLEKFLDDDKK